MKAKPIAVEYSGEVQFAALGVGCAAAVVVDVVVAPVVAAAAFGVGSVGIGRAADASRALRRPDF